jgi:ATP-dependent Clp protease ATP-binding subunit ClpA
VPIRGEFEERLKSALALLAVSKGEFLLLIDELHMIVGTGGGDGGMDVSNMLKPMLARGELRVIGTFHAGDTIHIAVAGDRLTFNDRQA